MAQITTLGDLSNFIDRISKERVDTYNRSLEEYLRSLLAVIDKYRSEPVTADLLAQVIAEAFTAEPVDFNPTWLTHEKAYFGWDYRDGKYIPNVLIGNKVKQIKHAMSDFELLHEVILFQIADLHRMKPQSSPFESQSSTGNVWHNVDVFANLECGIAGMIDHTSQDVQLSKCDWADLATLLESGRLYE